MFSLSIMVGAGQWRLLFKTEEKAFEAHNALSLPGTSETRVELRDDYGQRMTVNLASVHAFMLEDMRQSKLASVELALNEGRIRNAAMKAAQTDPELREATRGQGPSVITPNMNNGRGF